MKDYREISVKLILRGDTKKDYDEFSDEDVVEEFKTYYDINREDFTVKIEDSDGE